MMPNFRKLVLIASFSAGAILSLLRLLERAASAPDVDKQTTRSHGKRWIFRTATYVVLAAFGGFLFVTSGIMPIKASSGHWEITAWFLNFAMRRSVVTHSLPIEAPSLDDAGLVAKGATHYEFGCRPCHGAPELAQPVVAQQMTPAPPYLPPKISEWQADELFYIVKHGVKFTGMPAWPAQQRDDEVWAVVAFLQKLPRLSARDYHELTRAAGGEGGIDEILGPKDTPRVVSESCARCHASDGGGRGLGVFPVIAGQRPIYLLGSLLAYARGERHSGIMQPIAAALSREVMSELARYYAGLEGGLGARSSEGASQGDDAELVAAIERGRDIALRGRPSQRLPACAVCHGPSATARNPLYPELAGQYSAYLSLQLELFKKGKRGGTPYAHIMHMVAGRLTSQQINDVTSYYASLGGAPRQRQ